MQVGTARLSDRPALCRAVAVSGGGITTSNLATPSPLLLRAPLWCSLPLCDVTGCALNSGPGAGARGHKGRGSRHHGLRSWWFRARLTHPISLLMLMDTACLGLSPRHVPSALPPTTCPCLTSFLRAPAPKQGLMLKVGDLAASLVARRNYVTPTPDNQGVAYDPRFLVFEFACNLLLRQQQVGGTGVWGPPAASQVVAGWHSISILPVSRVEGAGNTPFLFLPPLLVRWTWSTSSCPPSTRALPFATS